MPLWLAALLAGATHAFGAAPCAHQDKDVVRGVVDEVGEPYLLEDARGERVAVQRVYLRTALDPRYTLDHADGGKADHRLAALMCHPALIRGATVRCEEAVGLDLTTTAVWPWIYDRRRFRCDLDGDGTLERSADCAPNTAVWIKGTYHADAGLPGADVDDRDIDRHRIHTFWPVSRVQPTQPRCGAVRNVGPEPDTTSILTNDGAGVQTFDGDLGDNEIDGLSGRDGTFGTIDPAAGRWRAYGTKQAFVDMPAFRAAVSTHPEPGIYDHVTHSNPRDRLRLSPDTEVPDFESTVAYGRVEWDFLWHGTCQVDGEPAWCLPDDHRRLLAHRHLDRDEILLVAASECDQDCRMDCPTAEGRPGEAKYDFHFVEPFVDHAWRRDDPARQGDEFLGPRQLASLRVMATNPVDHPTRRHPDYFSVPSFLEGCDEVELRTETECLSVNPSQCNDATFTWTRAAWNSDGMVEQHELLVRALSGDDSPGGRRAAPQVDTTLDGFVGYAEDPRVYSIDVGVVGSWGEWNSAMPGRSDSLWARTRLDFAEHPPDRNHAYGLLADDCSAPMVPWWDALFSHWSDRVQPPTVDAHGAFLIGKIRYSKWPIAHFREECYAQPTVDPATWGRGPLPDIVSRGGGLRFDSWLEHGLEALPDAEANREAFDAMLNAAGPAWEHAPYQAEVSYTFEKLLTYQRQVAGRAKRWSYHDLDAAVTWTLNHHFSVFNFKNQAVPNADAGSAFHAEGYDDRWCTCAPDGGSTCFEDAIERLLVWSGPRLNLHSASVPRVVASGTGLPVRLAIENQGNAPPYVPHSLAFWFHHPTRGLRGPFLADDLDATSLLPREHLCHEPEARRDHGVCDPTDTFSPTVPETQCETVGGEAPPQAGITDVAWDIPANHVPSISRWRPSGYRERWGIYFGFVDADGEPAMELASEDHAANRADLQLPGSDRMYWLGDIVIRKP